MSGIRGGDAEADEIMRSDSVIAYVGWVLPGNGASARKEADAW